MESLKIIHCIGDSHACFFGGYDFIQPGFPEEVKCRYPFLRSYRLGSVLAYSLNKLGTRERGREKILELVNILPYGATLLLCFGEIDCRCHLLKQAELQQKPLENCVRDSIQCYFELVDELRNKGFDVMIWNVVPSSTAYNVEYPTYGTLEERNECTVVYNRFLQEECLKRGIEFISIYKKLLNRKGRTKVFYYFDSVHLSQFAMPFAIDELYKKRRDILERVIKPWQIQKLFAVNYVAMVIKHIKNILSPVKRNLQKRFALVLGKGI